MYDAEMLYSSPASRMSNPELLDYSHEHLRYEIWMFFTSGVELARDQFNESDAGSVFIKNALVECFANHLRNLLLFLYPDGRPKPNDVRSGQFFSDPITDWKMKRPKKSKILEMALARASQEISHLTVLRREPDDPTKKWFVVNLMAEVRTILQVFIVNASAEKLNRSVNDLVNKIDLNAGSVKALEPLNFSTATTTAPITTVVIPSSTNHITSVSTGNLPGTNK